METRSKIIKGLFLVTGIVMLLRVGYMQLFDRSYRIKAETATLQKQTIYPSRGLIYDRNGKLIVYNQPIYDLYVIANLVSPEMDTARLCRVLEMDKKTFREKMERNWNDVRYSKNVPYLFLDKINAIKYAQLQEILHAFPGFSTEVRSVRGYQFPSAAHALGYISEVDQEIIDSSKGVYQKRDMYGVSGLEAHYEKFLKGDKGTEYQLKDNFGRKVGSYRDGERDASAYSGMDLISTIDIGLQTYAEELMNDKIGSIVAIEPKTGEILTTVSSPSYDPAMLSASADRAKTFVQLQNDTLKPFFNRTLMAKYPPGSIFKPILSLIALQEGVLTTQRYITCSGAYIYKTYRWGCHATPGVRNVVTAIEESCNTFFYNVYQDLVNVEGFENPAPGLNQLTEHLTDFGLGAPLMVDLPEEQGGLIPNSEFYDDMYEGKGDWRSTYIISNAIGQGEIELTTLQMANLVAIIANRGFYFRPHLLKRFADASIPLPRRFLTPKRVRIDDQHFDPVIQGMQRSVSQGTSTFAQVPGIMVCGKTGTSENPHGRDHSVFYAFAPQENPKIAVAVYIENGGWGGSYAAPIASLLIEKYLNRKIDPSRHWIEDRMIQANLLADL
ncbi:MAG: penicillin-binding protein 2 [Saprospiraceae bacterium]|nr:penicillin-binding protein 2 [Saprospiraceae bacterium]